LNVIAAASQTDPLTQMIPMAQLQMHQQQLADAARTTEFWTKRMAEIQRIDPHHPEVIGQSTMFERRSALRTGTSTTHVLFSHCR